MSTLSLCPSRSLSLIHWFDVANKRKHTKMPQQAILGATAAEAAEAAASAASAAMPSTAKQRWKKLFH